MVLIISQKTFDEAVRENMEALGLEPQEALNEAVIQFEAQGVDLSSIIKELSLTSSMTEDISVAVQKLKELIQEDTPDKILMDQMEIIKVECDKGIANRVAVGKAGAYGVLLDVLDARPHYIVVERTCLKTLTSLMTKQPDLLDSRGIQSMFRFLNTKVDFDLKKLTLRWIKECCVLHETNRQNIFNAKILENLKDLLKDTNVEIVREVLAAFRALVLDDDVRVEFGNAHEHARVIASEVLCQLTELMHKLQSEDSFIHDLMLTITALMVRVEFCKKVKDSDGIEMILDIMNNFKTNEKINRQCFKLITALAGNDDCKAYLIEKGLAPILTAALNQNKGNMLTTVAGLCAIAAITLRSPDNSKALFDAGIQNEIVDVMKIYSNEIQVQKAASRAIRNMVSRSRYQNPTFIGLGVEEVLVDNLKKFKEIEYDIKAALRDLGCNVHLKEEWTGKGGALTTSAV